MRFLIAAASILVLGSSAAYADRAAGDRCASTLPPASMRLYEASLAEVMGGELPRDALRANAREMVMNSTLSRANAQPAALSVSTAPQW